MKTIRYILFGLLAGILTNCSTDDIDVFDENNYISFDVQKAEEGIPQLSYTFTFLDESVRETVYEIPVTCAGRYRSDAATFVWKVVEEESTAKLNTHYQLVDTKEQVIEANKNSGKAIIRLLRTEDMKNQEKEPYELVLQLEENADFKTGAIDKVKIVITDYLVRPDWWDYNYTRNLGNYSSTKLRLFFEFMEVTDGSNPFDTERYVYWTDRGTGNFIYKEYRDAEIKTTVLEFRAWLYSEKNNPFDEDLKCPVVESLGNF